MNIYIDESGSFATAPAPGAWNVVAALAAPEATRRGLERAVHQMKTRSRRLKGKETKIGDIGEQEYVKFIGDLARLEIAVFCVATDAGRHGNEEVVRHQKDQVESLLEHIDKMKHEGGRKGVLQLASQLEKLPPQLYVQLFCQIFLMFDVVSRVILYFVQRNPACLREFRWRIDQKDVSRTNFEDAFEKLSPAILQTMSIEEPLMMVRGFDYSMMKKYEFKDGKPPEYLEKVYGIRAESGFNIQKLVRGDIKFMDSRDSIGIQAADLVVSGIRRCLRGEFADNHKVAVLLGRLMLSPKRGNQSLSLVSFSKEELLDKKTAQLVITMTAHSKNMVKRA